MTSYLGEIKMFAGNYAPAGWLLCDGSTLQITSYEALYSLIGITYGGDGAKTFQLPDLREQVVVGSGQLGMVSYTIGSKGGAKNVTLIPDNMPPHIHALQAYNDNATTGDPTGNNVLAKSVPQGTGYTDAKIYASLPAGTADPDSPLDPIAVSRIGGNGPHSNLMPYLTISYIISIEGLYPTQD
jgi:microcystin-dependent protein